MATAIVQSSTDKINSFLQDVQYHSLMVNSASFNVRLMRDRKTRLPFLDSQTGIAQSPCKLYMSSRHRMPGIQAGQLYAYPAQRWCRRRRSYITLAQQANRDAEIAEHTIFTVENPAASIATEDPNVNFESKPPEMYFYDDTSFLEEEEEEPPDNEEEDSSFTMRTVGIGRKKRKGPKPKSGVKGTRGRKKREPSNYKIITDAEDDNPGKPYECSLCGARYKTRQGLSYHLSHTHRTGTSGTSGPNNGPGSAKSTPPPLMESNSNTSNIAMMAPNYQQYQDHQIPGQQVPGKPTDPLTGLTEFQDSYLGFLATNQPEGNATATLTVPTSVNRKTNGGKFICQESQIQIAKSPIKDESCDSKDGHFTLIGNSEDNSPKKDPESTPTPGIPQEKEKERAPANSYCDFCLGNSSYNAKTGEPEELVSCADCGRSGHLTCLQFTPNMIISVRQYRWQCIECKCCTLCGTSENDDKLLFCDDCDRGYHLYCLEPPLSEPPEGEWACQLCHQQFHKHE